MRPESKSQPIINTASTAPRIQVIPSESLLTKNWSGGVTTELLIYPVNSSYEKQDFEFRISTATVETGGPFTAFPDHQRILMLMSGSGIDLSIDGKVETLQDCFQQFEFSGSSKVTAVLLKDKIEDLNVIFKPNVEVQISQLTILPQSQLIELTCDSLQSFSKSRHFHFLYSPENMVILEGDGQTVQLRPRDVFLLEQGSEWCSGVRLLGNPVPSAVIFANITVR